MSGAKSNWSLLRALVPLALAVVGLWGCEEAVPFEPPPVPGDPGVPIGPGSASKAGALKVGRIGATHTVLDDGRIAVIGGALPKPEAKPADLLAGNPEAFAKILDTVEIYDPYTGKVEVLSTEPASPQTAFYPRAFHQAVLFPGTGKVVVVGGYTQVSGQVMATPSVEVFDVDARTFLAQSALPPLSQPRVHHTASLLDYRNGNGVGDVYVLVAGGLGEARFSFEVWTPRGVTGSGAIPVRPRWGHKAVVAEHYYTYLVGGEDPDGTIAGLDVFDKEQGLFLKDGQIPESLQAGGRVGHDAVWDPDLRALYVIGGFGDKSRTSLVAPIDVISTRTGKSLVPASANFSLRVPRAFASSAWLAGGEIVLTGGVNQDFAAIASAEIIEDKGGQIGVVKGRDVLPARFGHRAFAMSEDTLVLIGGGMSTAAGTVTPIPTIQVVSAP